MMEFDQLFIFQQGDINPVQGDMYDEFLIQAWQRDWMSGTSALAGEVVSFTYTRKAVWLQTYGTLWLPGKPVYYDYLFFFLCRFLRRRFLRLWVAILCLFLFLPQGMVQFFL